MRQKIQLEIMIPPPTSSPPSSSPPPSDSPLSLSESHTLCKRLRNLLLLTSLLHAALALLVIPCTLLSSINVLMTASGSTKGLFSILYLVVLTIALLIFSPLYMYLHTRFHGTNLDHAKLITCRTAVRIQTAILVLSYLLFGLILPASSFNLIAHLVIPTIMTFLVMAPVIALYLHVLYILQTLADAKTTTKHP
jgi:hypothetical protein